MTKKKYQRYSSEFKSLALRRASEDGVTDMESPPSVTEVYDLPRQYDEGGFSRLNRLAFVWPRTPAAKTVAQFYDTAGFPLSGLSVRQRDCVS